MFQEELQKLQLRVVELQEQLSKEETQRRGLGEKLGAAISRADNAESALKTKERELIDLRNDLSVARRSVEMVSSLEQALVVEQEKTKTAMGHVSSLSADQEQKSKQLREAEHDLAEALAGLSAASEKLEPVENLLAALTDLYASETVVKAQLKRLNG